jgi:multiple sugar transport system substrate-binding protein
MKRRKWSILMGIVLVASLLLVSCSQAASAPADAEVDTAGESSAEKASIRVMTFFAYDNPEVEEGVVAAFEEAYPNIDVQLDLVSYNDIFTKLKADIAAGTPPDVISMNYENLRQFASLGAIESLEDYVAADEYDMSIYFENTVAMHTLDGTLYGLPATFSDVVLFYNKTMFDEAGVAYPDASWDWDKLNEEGAKFVEDVDGDGVVDTYGYGPAWWPMYLFLFDTNILTADNSQCALNTPEGLQAVQALIDLQAEDGISANQEAQASQGDWDRFIAGKLAMFQAGPWAVKPFNDNIADFEWDITDNPSGTTQGTFLYSNTYAITSGSEAKDAAWEFIKFATGEEGSTIRQNGQFEISTVKNVADSIFVESMKGQSPAHPEIFMSATAYGQKLSEHPRFQEILDAIQPELDLAMLGDKSVEDAMNAACDAVNAIIAEE